MAIVLPVGRPKYAVEECPGANGLGWRICVGHQATGCVGVLPGADRLRVVVAEPLSKTCPRGLRQRLVGLAGELLAAGAGLAESADALMRHADEDRRTAPQAGLTLLDLLPDGEALVACRYAPSAVHVTADGLSLRPAMPGTGNATVTLARGDHLLAYSGTFLEVVPPGILADLADLPGRRAELDSCGLWHTLAAGCDPLGPAPDLAVITRTR
ncbi:MAG TPA: hypothetical protein VFX70_18645 [Mycobacteriales bacterium]|nr:hypothetical protein [Mycobacteriales bacterium]